MKAKDPKKPPTRIQWFMACQGLTLAVATMAGLVLPHPHGTWASWLESHKLWRVFEVDSSLISIEHTLPYIYIYINRMGRILYISHFKVWNIYIYICIMDSQKKSSFQGREKPTTFLKTILGCIKNLLTLDMKNHNHRISIFFAGGKLHGYQNHGNLRAPLPMPQPSRHSRPH